MTFQPVLAWPLLLAVAVVLIGFRLLSLHRLRSGSHCARPPLWRWCAVTSAVLLMLVAAARPGVGAADATTTSTGAERGNLNVFYVVDRSSAGAVTDYADGKARIDGVRSDIATLTARYPGARFALITFTSRPSLDWPLSADSWSFGPQTTALRADETAQSRTQVDAAAAANVLRYQLIAAGQQYPGSQNIVFYFGFGAPGSQAPQGEFDLAPHLVDGGTVFGYGATDGPQAMNENQLRRVAEQLGIGYVNRIDAEPLPPTASPQGRTESAQNSAIVVRTQLYWLFALAACPLLLVEVYLSVRDLRRSRAAHREVTL